MTTQGPGKLFQLESPFQPIAPQEETINFLIEGLKKGVPQQILKGVTGSGKTFMVANIIARTGRPALILSHNKTLCAQLYQELAEFFPENSVDYFISYYDYYQPEAYVPGRDLYIEKTSQINDEIDQFRHRATRALFERKDVVIVASVSCIYGLGSPDLYRDFQVELAVGKTLDRSSLASDLIRIQYERNDIAFERGHFRIRGDTLDIFPASEKIAIRVEFFGNEIENLFRFDPLSGEILEPLPRVSIFPARHYLMPEDNQKEAIRRIEEELKNRVLDFKKMGKWVEAERLESRTKYDLEMMKQVGYCSGIENYSRHLSLRGEGEPPDTLLNYFPPETIFFIDESHATLPQLHGMYAGDRSRKDNLVEYGYRLPSARDNRPLTYEEYINFPFQRIYVSATPAPEEKSLAGEENSVEQLIRPTGILDPEIIIHPRKGQMDFFLSEIKKGIERGERTLAMVMTKKMAEKLQEFIDEQGIKSRYLYSEIESLERVEIIRGLRLGEFDVLVGINLLREGLDLPEVSLIAIFDADQEGFLRSPTSLLQISGRAARNINGRVIFFADKISRAMKLCMDESDHRRQIQASYNKENGIVPRTIIKKVFHSMKKSITEESAPDSFAIAASDFKNEGEFETYLDTLYQEMSECSEKMDFEKAAQFRDKIRELKSDFLDLKLAGSLKKS